jgi:hypothetical protein
MPFGCGPHGEAQSILKGEGGDFLQVQAVAHLMSPSFPMVHFNTKSASTMH